VLPAAVRGLAGRAVAADLIGSAHWIAAVRARESSRADRLFDDPWAGALAGSRGVAAMERSEAASGGENAFLPVRTRFFDDLVLARAADQVVMLGAGLDTRPYRLPLSPHLTWYEIDHPGPLSEKTAVLGGAVPRCALIRVPTDVLDGWALDLAAAGWDSSRPTLWIAEGLFFYLPASGVSALLAATFTGSAAGSALGADVMGATGLVGPGLDAYRRYAASAGLPPPFGSDDPARLFAGAGWAGAVVSRAGGPDANFGRLPEVPDGRPGTRANLVVASR
jgi:methyltransferase (TIGR00027 family)